MSARRRLTYQQLLRWYPRRWRQLNSEVMLDTLEENADSRGFARPTAGEAWSLRAHGLAQHATPGAIIGGASAALLLSLVAPIVLYVVGGYGPRAQVVSVTAQFLGALLVTLAAGAWLLRAGVIRPESALVACVVAVPAWVFGGLAAASSGIGFDEADAGATQSWFGNATGIFFLGAWVVGAIALLPIAFAILRAVPSQPLRVVLSVVLCVPSALALGIAAVVPAGMVLGATAILIAASFQLRGRPSRPTPVGRATGVLTLAKRRRIAAVTAVTAVLGAGCAVFALTGSSWAPAFGDSTQAMRTGILAGALIATITIVAAASALFPRMGRAVLGPATALIAALLTLATSYALDIDSPFGWPLLLTAAALTGLAGGLIFTPFLPGSSWLRALLSTAISIAVAASLGLMMITTAAFLAPALAVVATILLLRQPRRSLGPQTI